MTERTSIVPVGDDGSEKIPADLPADTVQFLDPDGIYQPSHTADRFQSHADHLDQEQLQQLYQLMATTRRIDNEATSLQRQGELVLWASCFGQEAAQAGAVFALDDTDHIFPTYREHVMAFHRGVPVRDMLTFFRGAKNSGWDSRDFNIHPYTIVLGTQVPQAVGYSWGTKLDYAKWQGADLKHRPPVTLACFGDGTSSEGDVHAGMVYAASQNTPTLFFCQNNRWAISVPFNVQSRVPISTRAAGYGFEGINVDGNDPIAMFAVTQWAAERIRSGKGPVLIEAHTYRRGAHTTADDPTKYRTKDEEDAYARLDPLRRTEAYLRRQYKVDDDFFEQIATDADAQANQLRDMVLAMAPENTLTLEEFMQNTYAEPHPLIDEELAEYRQYHAGFADEPVANGGER
ncbi:MULTISPECIES: thiamine pyrophosphate-dependent enzyme [Auritidibacter]|uniref:thiamine pyrophosphate-dependent enzyme n=1 Tax=Auritidibacter TaxID=1160973 RepID=UPI000D73060D|nr:thiamine pyrophosphate-dependent enzyme [Auritidibacter sp. NML130574]AXR74744.1 pyruvate dehydrogenase (acetyl-transferring) E1 component subunit alpha [Auritidibacter sp. NML130574]